MIIWGSDSGGADLGMAEQPACATYERERPFKVLMPHRWAASPAQVAPLMMRFLAVLILVMSSFSVIAEEEKASSRSALKGAFELAREAQNIDLVLPALRAAQLYVIVRPDADDPKKQVLYLVPSPKGRPSVTVSESLETLQKVPWPKRRITGSQLMAELEPGQEIVIAYPDGGDHVTGEQLEWFKHLP